MFNKNNVLAIYMPFQRNFNEVSKLMPRCESESVSRSVMSELFVTPWTVAHQAPLSMGFLRQEYCSGLPFPSPGDIPDSGIETTYPALAGGCFNTLSHLGGSIQI